MKKRIRQRVPSDDLGVPCSIQFEVRARTRTAIFGKGFREFHDPFRDRLGGSVATL